jgi:hypothetical protein
METQQNNDDNEDTWQTLGKASASLLGSLSKISEECLGSDSRFAQIDEPIVGSFSVDVVDHIRRPTTVNIKPNNTMNCTYAAANSNPEISTCTWRPRDHSLLRSGTGRDATSNDSGRWVISEELANQIRGYRFRVAWRTASHCSKPHEKKNEERADNRRRSEKEKRDDENHREAVEQRLRDIAVFEKIVSGAMKRRKKF